MPFYVLLPSFLTDVLPAVSVLNSKTEKFESNFFGAKFSRLKETNISIDKISYPGETTICYFNLTPEDDRIFGIGYVLSSENADVWNKYISQPRILIINVAPSSNTGWVSIRAGLDS